MKLRSILLVSVLFSISCKPETVKKDAKESIAIVEKENEIVKPLTKVKERLEIVRPKTSATSAPYEKQVEKTKQFPKALVKIFDAHGGLDVWNSKASLEYTHFQKAVKSVTKTNLGNRHIVTDMTNHVLGYDGSDVWLKKKNKRKYKKDARFMYNLFFYFFGMPFVLADDGIVFSDAKPLTVEGKTYPGIGISYDDEIGESPKDDYVIYYDPETYQMVWLSYTMTFFSKKKSKELRFRRYKDWQRIDGLLVPSTSERFSTAKNLPTKIMKASRFEDVRFLREKFDDGIFKIPSDAVVK